MQSFANSIIIKNHIEAFAQHYLPNGVRKGKEWVVGDVNGGKGTSMNFCLEGEKAGLWIDNATRDTGNPITLVMKQKQCSFDEAVKELEELFNIPPVPEFKPRAPVKQPATKEFMFKFLGADKATPLMMVHRYEYVDDNGEVTKASRPYKLSDDGTAWIPGAPEKRPLYRLDKLRAKTPIILVEGEKKADYLAEQLKHLGLNFDVLAWPMGASQAHKADWMPIYDRKVVIWPDNDEAGFKAANAIKDILHTAAILPIPKTKPPAWDCGDATPEEIKAILNPQSELPFEMLGSDKDKYYFYLPQNHTLYAVRSTDITMNVLLFLAPLDWWMSQFMKQTKQGFAVDAPRAIDWINREQQKRGKFSDRTIYGAGTEVLDGQMLVNCGSAVYLDGIQTDERSADKYIIQPERTILDPYKQSAEFDYQQVVNIIKTFNIADNGADLLLGWICLAPICGLLKWKPHIWLTGTKGSGKSTMLNEVMSKLLADWKIYLSGTMTTEAGIRRTIKTSTLPVILDEAEGNRSDINARNMQKILTLITVASTKDDSEIRQAGNKEAEAFRVNNMFCLACTTPPVLTPAEYSRISPITMSPVKTKDDFSFNPQGSFIARQVQEAPKILAVVRESIKVVKSMVEDGRFADQYGALLGAAAYMRTNGMITLKELAEYLRSNFEKAIKQQKADQDYKSNEGEQFLRLLINYQIKEGQFSYVIGDLIMKAGTYPYCSISKETLGKYGMKVDDGHLYIVQNNPQLNEIGKKLHSEHWFMLLEQSDGLFEKGERDKPKRIGMSNTYKYVRIPTVSLDIISQPANPKVVDMFGYGKGK